MLGLWGKWTHFSPWSLKINTFKNQRSLAHQASGWRLFQRHSWNNSLFFAEGSLSPASRSRIPRRSVQVHLSRIEGRTFKEIFPMQSFESLGVVRRNTPGRGLTDGRGVEGSQASLLPRSPLLMVGVCALCCRTQVQPGSLSPGLQLLKTEKKSERHPSDWIRERRVGDKGKVLYCRKAKST